MFDEGSGILRFLFKALGGGNPARLISGVALGKGASVLIAVLLAEYPLSPSLAALDKFSLTYVLIGLALAFSPILIGSKGAPEPVVQHINAVRLMIENGSFTKVQRQMIWHSLVNRYINAARPDLSGQVDVEAEAKSAIVDIKGTLGS